MATPTGILFSDPRVKPLSTTGQFQSGCYLCFFATGTTTLQNVFSDGMLTTPLSQPAPGSVNPAAGTVSAADGRFVPIYMSPGIVYRVQMYNAAGVLLEDTDPYVPTLNLTPSNIGQALFPQTTNEIAAGVTPTNYAYQPGDIRRYGAVGDGVTDCTTAFLNAVAVIAQPSGTTNGGGLVFVPAGQWLVSSLITITKSGITIGGTNGCGKWNGATNVYTNGSCIIKKSTMTTDVFKVDGAVKTNFKDVSIVGQTGNTGDGIYLKDGIHFTLDNVGIAKMGGNGLRLGPRTGDVGSANAWEITSSSFEFNGGHGLYIFDQNTPTAPNANAGTARGISCNGNTGDGIHNENGILNTFLGVWCQQNTGFGISIIGNASIQMYNQFHIDDLEQNTAGNWNLGAQARHVMVTGPASAIPSTLDPSVSFGAVFSGGQALVRSLKFSLGANAMAMSTYEEGTWTPSLSVASGSVTLDIANGQYTKIGRMVYYACTMHVSAISAPSGALNVTGLPYISAAAAGHEYIPTVYVDSAAAGATTAWTGDLSAGTQAVLLRTYAAGATSSAGAFMQVGTTVRVTGFYAAAAE